MNGNGGGNYAGNNSASWSTTSDRRIKKNIVDSSVGLDVVKQIQVRNFEYRLPEEIEEITQSAAIPKVGTQVGAIAQELMEVIPECVTQENNDVYAVNQEPVVWALVKALQELSAKNDALEARLTTLEG